MKRFILFTVAISFSQGAYAKDIKIANHREDIAPYVRAADVWSRPAWINSNLQFTSSPDLINGPPAKGYTELLVGGRNGVNQVICQQEQEDQERDFGGKTPKFYCQIVETVGRNFVPVTKSDGSRQVIKVKYNQPGKINSEIPGEILGTRLLWALGFGADQMFYVDELNCFGCSLDPFRDRQVVPNGVVKFDGVAIEKKMSGDELISPVMITSKGVEKKVWSSGIRFAEIMKYLPTSPEQKQAQVERRDALRLLAIFMQHMDLKNDNQRFVCLKKDGAGKCIKPFIMIQDIGSSFGTRFKNLTLDKVHFRSWRDTPVWRNPSKCQARMGTGLFMDLGTANNDGSMVTPQISESGRQFLAKLLVSFASDRNRVRNLFRAAHIERGGREGSLEEWVDAFNSRVAQIANPTGQRGFKCPKARHE